MTMGQRIAQGRKALGLSQEALAEVVGVSRQAVSKWELDEAQPDAAKVILLAQALKMSTDQLLLGVEPPDPSPSAKPADELRADHLGTLTRLVKKHGYKAGYILIADGLVLMLVAGLAALAFHSFFGAVTRDISSPVWREQSIQEIELHLAPGVTLSPEEREVIAKSLQEQAGVDTITATPEIEVGFPAGIQVCFYIILAIPAVIGAALVAVGIVVIVKFKGKSS